MLRKGSVIFQIQMAECRSMYYWKREKMSTTGCTSWSWWVSKRHHHHVTYRKHDASLLLKSYFSVCGQTAQSAPDLIWSQKSYFSYLYIRLLPEFYYMLITLRIRGIWVEIQPIITLPV